MRAVGKVAGVAVAALAATAVLAACGGGGGSASGGEADGKVEMIAWHNSPEGAGFEYWEELIAAFEAEYPNVTIKQQGIQNEDYDEKLQTAINSGDAPDIWGMSPGGKFGDVVAAGKVMDITDGISEEARASIGEAAFSSLTYDGKIYGMPGSILADGIFYNQDLFDEAGITENPTTFKELEEANAKLRAKGIEPIALGGKDAWPAAHWFYYLSVRQCSEEAINADSEERKMTDPCWERAAQDLLDFAATEPFNQGFMTISSQQGAGSSAGLLANGKAAMELMGTWEPGVVAGLTPDQKPLASLRSFNFPAVEGGDGDPKGMLGSVGENSCSVDAPPECVDFLNFSVSDEMQKLYYEKFLTIPVNAEAQKLVTDPSLTGILEAYREAPYMIPFIDQLFGQAVGEAINQGVVDMLAGNLDAPGFVEKVNQAAVRG